MKEIVQNGWLVNLIVIASLGYAIYLTFNLTKSNGALKLENDQIKTLVVNRDRALNLFVQELQALNNDGVRQVLAKYNVKQETK